MSQKLPVTVLSGFLGAVIANDMSEVNIDEALPLWGRMAEKAAVDA